MNQQNKINDKKKSFDRYLIEKNSNVIVLLSLVLILKTFVLFKLYFNIFQIIKDLIEINQLFSGCS